MKIGIPAYSRNGLTGVGQQYLDYVSLFGTPVIMTKNISENYQDYGIGGFLLPGGADINPFRYGMGMMKFWCDPYDPDLEWFDTKILPDIISKKLPIFGICRGLQTLNVALGGTLYPHLRGHPVSKNHEECSTHTVYLKNGEKIWTNSFHHQGIWRLGKGLEVLGTSFDGIPEIIRHREFPIAAVQYHPERMIEVNADKLVQNLFGDKK